MKNLASKFIIGSVIIGVLSGCGDLVRPREFPEGMIHGVKYKTMTQETIPYKLEEQILYQDREYFEETNGISSCLPMRIKRFVDTTKWIDMNSKKVELKSDKIYIPYKVESKKFTKDKWIDEVELTGIGPFGIRAEIETIEELSKLAGEDKNIFGYNVITTEEGASFGIRTIKIFGEEYFFPRVENKKLNENGKLDYYLIPVEGSKVGIKNSCGNVYIRNENNVYRPTEVRLIPEITEGISSFHR